MKFAHQFQVALQEEGFPEQWVKEAFPYKQLKKTIKRVANELEAHNVDLTKLPEGSFEYNFKGDRKGFTPKLTLFYENKPGSNKTQPVKSILSLFPRDPVSTNEATNEAIDQAGLDANSSPSTIPDAVPGSEKATDYRQVEIVVPLMFDAEFFGLIQGDVQSLDQIQQREREDLVQEVNNLHRELVPLAEPAKNRKKSDMYKWRELFEIYLDAGVFFSRREESRGPRTSAEAKKQLEWFQGEVKRRGLATNFQLPGSKKALDRFLKINVTLWQNLKYQEINQQAVGKILKKFDKNTHLGASQTFSKLIESHSIMSEDMAKAICAKINDDVVNITPKLSDYICPVCTSIVWRPIRLKCQHNICVNCCIHFQNHRMRFCPLCRAETIMEADTDSIDADLSRYLKRYFVDEVREKQIENEIKDGRERFGVLYRHPTERKHMHCSVM
ncbi:SPX domain-containing protein [Calycina marina]|uniref:SPX domain-containing protein n=1 Tax=Calycina marina TaxID=1763456 RepID=A0A9P7Z9R9_9HELO|nr:SPX domain-containing protein [Calycina marina]